MSAVEVDPSGDYLTLLLDEQRLRFHAIWLRDNAPDPATRSSDNGQRLIAIRDVPADTRIERAEIEADHLALTFAPENKIVRYDLHWLNSHAYDRVRTTKRGWVPKGTDLWNSKLTQQVPTGDFRDLRHGGQALREWLGHVVRYGFAKVVGGPVEDRALFGLVDLFGFVRQTNYGRHFEVRTEINPSNLAFTGLGLQAHTDNPYRDPAPTVQVLYCLESTAAGGENMVVDGFAVATRLRQENPGYFDLLAEYCARFEYAGEQGVRLASRRPMIELTPDGELIAVRFNNRSLAAVTDIPFDSMKGYYAAYRRFAEIIDDPAMEVSFRLEPGEAFVVDNTRVLHARKGYSGNGRRWLQGCYADMDGVRSTYAALCETENAEAAE